ncbi:spore germination protein [Metabacillus sp. 84]|uniref:spore germination protein n=1 Tax=Metabacillus sp. 84 TaxID=3404705 RepID=UPI003CEF1740
MHNSGSGFSGQKRLLSSGKAEETVQYVKDAFFQADDLKMKQLIFNGKPAYIMYIDSIADRDQIQTNVLKPLLKTPEGKIEDLAAVTILKKTYELEQAVQAMLEGDCLFFTDGRKELCLLNVYKKDMESGQEPNNEKIIRGSHQSFSENVMKNIHFIRERIKSPALTVKFHSVGRTSRSKLAFVYVGKIANPALMEEIERRLSYLQVDSVQSPGYFEEFIEDCPFSPFPQILNTERPDRAAANLMDGRIAVLMEGSPTVLILPATFFSFFQSSEDYNMRTVLGSFFRLIRVISFIIALILPAFYIALVSFNYEVIPVEIVFSIKNSLEFVPFQPVLEAMIMQLTLELLREAAIRLPNAISQTIGVVGGLVIGTAVVDAHLVSNTMIIVVAITAISSFVIPSNEMSNTIRILGFPIMLMSALFGFFGIVISMMLILVHLVKLQPFGSPYLYPLAPFNTKFFKDTVLRFPVWMMNERPEDAKPVYLWKESRSRGWKRNE